MTKPNPFHISHSSSHRAITTLHIHHSQPLTVISDSSPFPSPYSIPFLTSCLRRFLLSHPLGAAFSVSCKKQTYTHGHLVFVKHSGAKKVFLSIDIDIDTGIGVWFIFFFIGFSRLYHHSGLLVLLLFTGWISFNDYVCPWFCGWVG